MTCFLGCCVQLLQILMEVTGVLFKNQHPFSFLDYYVSTKSAGGDSSMENEQLSTKHDGQCSLFLGSPDLRLHQRISLVYCQWQEVGLII